MSTRRLTLRSVITSLAVIVPLIAPLVFHGAGEFFMPHAHCYLFNSKLIALHGYSDLVIGLSYVSISATLVYVVKRARRELPFHWMMLAFAIFIVACGATHFMEVWTLRAANPPYWFAGWVKLVTACASVTTAILLPPLIPKILRILRSTREASEHQQELAKVYRELSDLYRKARKPAPRKESIAALIEAGEQSPTQLADMAREVGHHARELERAKQAAEEANRAKDQFLAVLSHELRTPLTPALAAASNLESAENIDPAELKESLALIRRNIELEARLVDDLLDLTRISKGKLRIHLSTINLHETIRHAVEMCESEARQKLAQLVVDLEAAHYHVRGDGGRLAQVFWNVILNAVKFTPAEGRISVKTSNSEPGKIIVEITDSGIGIEPNHLGKIFEPFQQAEETTTRRYGGLGLGLTVAKGLVDAHDGTIIATSAGKDLGATFRVELATVTPPAAPKVVSAPANAEAQVHRRILIAEDHADTRQALERIVGRWGHEVRTASTIVEAVSVAQEFNPEVLISDIGLPDGTGIDLLGKLLPTHQIIAVAMSGYGMEADLEQTRHAGFKEHLIKPVSAERLKECLDQLLAGNFPNS